MTEAKAPILFRNTMRITDGHLEGYKSAIRKAVDFATEHGPQLMVEVFIDEDRMECTSFQLYADSDAVLRHWELADPYIQGVMEHCVVQDFEVFGNPDDRVRSGLGPNVKFTPHLTGFHRLGGSS
ncbi:hypothetical protein F1721_05345 [Saccharopolyspora hirsuta]|uniref:ABM domain-containing protein n=1 Tax=Saccharopolyspora hirsuta TaxID=1837 RepID=A0A5M7CFJ1_SACHI|nr:hypothetical protein [Saccharopolyspora hirsuta]KAA5837225.1 hypothetical protein F1721_05345 [Saccharopolyspora hirsuta]